MSTLSSQVKKQTIPIFHSKASKPRKDQSLVFFVGGFATGKSTLINALIRRQLLKTSIRPEAAVLTRIINGKNSDTVTVTYRDPYRPDRVIPYEHYKREFRIDDENFNKFDEIAYVTITNEMRNETVSFAESPGLCFNDLVYDALADVFDAFADRADAIVMVMSAARLGSDYERYYIQRDFAGRGLRNVFFVINYYNWLKPEDEADFLKQLKSLIGCVFTDADGNFDEELYKQRVFLVDAYTSMCARTGGSKPEKKGNRFIETFVAPEEDAYTGVPELEQALNKFLDSICVP